jgi:hypothetical protein
MDVHDPLFVSPEIAEAARSARTEAQARTERSDRRQCVLLRRLGSAETRARCDSGKGLS